MYVVWATGGDKAQLILAVCEWNVEDLNTETNPKPNAVPHKSPEATDAGASQRLCIQSWDQLEAASDAEAQILHTQQHFSGLVQWVLDHIK